MNVPAMLALTTLAGSVVMAACAWVLSTSPGWSGLRWYSGVVLSGALYAACELVVSSAAPDAAALWAGRLTLVAGALFIYFWVPFSVVLERRTQRLPIERVLRAVALVLAVLSLIPGVMTGHSVNVHTPGNFGVVYREMEPTTWTFVPITFFILSVAWYALRLMLIAVRSRRLLHVGRSLSLWVLVAATVHDALVIEGVFSSPYLLVSAFLVVMIAIGAGILRRLVTDARELARVSEELAEAQVMLVHRERLAAVGEVAAVVAHEVRNPLAVLYNVVSQLRHQFEPHHPGRQLVEMAAEESERLERLVSDLLDFTSPQPPRIAPCDLHEVLHTAVRAALTSTRLGEGQVTIVRAPDDGLIEADEALLYRAAVNLVTNALQAPGRIEPVQIRVEGGRDGVVEIEVEDEGDGVPEAIREKIFDPFFTTRATGTGLGLSLARRATEAHGGTLTLSQREGRGACFRLSLPVRASRLLRVG